MRSENGANFHPSPNGTEEGLPVSETETNDTSGESRNPQAEGNAAPAAQAGGNEGEAAKQQQGGRDDRRGRGRNRHRNQQRGNGNNPNRGGGNIDADEEFVEIQGPNTGVVIDLNELKRRPAHQLLKMAEELGIQEGAARARKQDVVFLILKSHARAGGSIVTEGVLEILQDGFGFLRTPDESYLAGPDDIYISPSQIRRFNLRTGDNLTGRVRPPKEGERYFALLKVDTINGEPPEASKNKVLFEN
ncbi:MAG: Rho termination factor N-terminal domain-containing protein, partial [Proteobacteria bacterium]|nr:Rho termination factor N-terminal domain-containing protein [Pseudomonadota bacterium]